MGCGLFEIRQLLSYGQVWHASDILQSIQCNVESPECYRKTNLIQLMQLGRRLCPHSEPRRLYYTDGCNVLEDWAWIVKLTSETVGNVSSKFMANVRRHI